MESIVDYANEQFGNDLGIYAVITSIILISILSRQVMIFLLPKIFAKAIKKSEKFAQIEINSRNSIGTATLGLIIWKSLEQLSQVGFPGTIIIWCSVIAKLIFLIFIIRAALKMIDGITIAVGLIDRLHIEYFWCHHSFD